MDADLQRVSHYRSSAYPCRQCQAPREDQILVRGPTGFVWKCGRCNAETSDRLPFDPRKAPSGKAEVLPAIETLAVFVPSLQSIDPELVYPVVRPYFEAGWCVRDVLHALNYLPTGDTHPGQGAAWVRGEVWDRTLWRMRQRLRSWRLSDRDDGEDIMQGPYTATSIAMSKAAAAQHRRAADRSQEWHERSEAARRATQSGARELARRQAAIAARLARQVRGQAEQRERERMMEEFARGRSAAAVWLRPE